MADAVDGYGRWAIGPAPAKVCAAQDVAGRIQPDKKAILVSFQMLLERALSTNWKALRW